MNESDWIRVPECVLVPMLAHIEAEGVHVLLCQVLLDMPMCAPGDLRPQASLPMLQ